MKNFIRDYLTFNKRERNGVFILISIITLLLVWLNISDRFVKEEQTDFSKFEAEIARFNLAMQEQTDSGKIPENKNNKQKQIESAAVERFYFNPNNLPEEDWKRLGFSQKQINVIKNYENKGGKFKTKEDVKKMYCITPKQYASIEPYIKIEVAEKEQPAVKVNENVFANKNVFPLLEINTADSVQLVKLKGIGAYFATKIIKYRNLLGGFLEKEQLMEVWNLDRNKYNEFEQYITLDVSKVKRININTCSAQELKHPYLKWNQVNAIVNYREKHGKYKTVDEIKQTDLVDDETLRKIAPYLTVD
jgi:competence ComEA-like helix-hairpin-helix protein